MTHDKRAWILVIGTAVERPCWLGYETEGRTIEASKRKTEIPAIMIGGSAQSGLDVVKDGRL